MFLGIEIGGTKLQLGIGRGDRAILSRWRGEVDPKQGAEGIRQQIVDIVPQLFNSINTSFNQIRGIGVGFGGPTDDRTQSVIKSHHIAGWDNFPLASWLESEFGLPAVICNDADVACLAETQLGAGQGCSPVMYMTIGTGIGGGLTIKGELYRGCGRGAIEVGHLVVSGGDILESWAAGWGIAARVRDALSTSQVETVLKQLGASVTARDVAEAARENDPLACQMIAAAVDALSEALLQVIKLLCPQRIVIGGGVSLMGNDLLFEPLRQRIDQMAFPPFRGLTEIVPAELGEEVVVYGALALAKARFG